MSTKRCIVWLVVAVLFLSMAMVTVGQEMKPDLVIVKIEKIGWGINFFKVIATVKNVGEAPSTPTHLKWGATKEGSYAAIVAIPALAPGEEVDVVIYSGVEPFDPPWLIITLPVYLEVDPFNRVQEENEENNTKYGVFSYRAKPWPGPRPRPR